MERKGAGEVERANDGVAITTVETKVFFAKAAVRVAFRRTSRGSSGYAGNAAADGHGEGICRERGFIENFGSKLIARVGAAAPGVRLCFVQKVDKDSASLREGTVDLDTGVVGNTMGPEVRTQSLFRDRLIGVVRMGHLLSHGPMNLARYSNERHIAVSRRGLERGPIDEALALLGIERDVATIVSGFATALRLARESDLIASAPERHTSDLRVGICSFPLPVPTPGMTVCLLWHPRLDADPAHQWLRGVVLKICESASETAI